MGGSGGGLGSVIGGGLGLVGSLFGGGGSGGGSGGGGGYDNTMIDPILNQYKSLYSNYYWPMEQMIAGWYNEDLNAARPYYTNMRDYQLGRGDELINLAKETDPTLDQNWSNLVNTLTQDKSTLTRQYRNMASADVASAYNNAQQQSARSMNMYGINPNSGAFTSAMNDVANDRALAMSGARTQAARNAEDTALQRNMQAMNLYVNPQMQYTAQQSNLPQAGISVGGLLSGGMGASQQAMQQQQVNNQNNAAWWSGIGNAINMIGGGLSGMSQGTGWQFGWGK